jgi:hypothetical protein
MPAGDGAGEGRVERIGQPGGECADSGGDSQVLGEIAGRARRSRAWPRFDAVGFKAVHAGPLNQPQIIDDALSGGDGGVFVLAPAHNPPYIAAIRAFGAGAAGRPLVAVLRPFPYRFMDEAATTYAVPYEWRTEHGIGATGFTGPAIARPASAQALLGGATCATSPATWAAARAWRRFATAWRSTPALARRRSRGCRRTTAWATSTCLPCCT